MDAKMMIKVCLTKITELEMTVLNTNFNYNIPFMSKSS